MNQFLISIAAFLVAIGILITIHEFGHFWVARRLGVKVIRFSIGFGRPLFTWRRPNDPTEYVLSALPFGGYVEMVGERPDDDNPVAPEDLPFAFNRQAVWKRAAIVLAGPVCNLLFAFIAYWLIIMAGEVGTRPEVGVVTPDSVAAEAGFVPGDVIVQVDGAATPTWSAVWFGVLEGALDADDLPVQVRTADGQNVMRYLPGSALAPLDPGQNVLAAIGLRSVQVEVPPVLDEVSADQPAGQAGLRSGDRIAAIDGQAVANWEDLVAIVRANPEKSLQFQVERGADTLQLTITPAAVTAEDGSRIGRIGATPALPTAQLDAQQVLVRLGPLDAGVAAAQRLTDVSVLTLRIIGRMFTGQASLKSLSGPIGIADTAGKTATLGIGAFINFLALLSVSLGVLNLLPLPMLDGGHLFWYLGYELITRRPFPANIQQHMNHVGMVLLISLMSLAVYIDVTRFFD